MEKVKNVIKGYQTKYEIEEVTFFENDKVLYSGAYQEFINSVAKPLALAMGI